MEEVTLCGGRGWEAVPVAGFTLVVRQRWNDLCPAVIYLPGPSQRKPLGVVGSTGTCPPGFEQTPPLQIGWECVFAGSHWVQHFKAVCTGGSNGKGSRVPD